MESAIKGLLKVRFQPQLQFVRWNNKVNITKPRPPHFNRALVEKLCLPYFSTKKKPKYVPDFKSCRGQPKYKSKLDQDHPLLKLLAEQSYNKFNNSKLIAFFQLNSLPPEEKFEMQLLCKKNGMKLVFLSKVVLQKALTGTQFESVLLLYNGPTVAAFAPEPDIHTLMSFYKKMPKLPLMAAIVENRFLSLTELQRYASYKSITDARLNLLSVFNSASQHLVQQLNSHPTNLVGLLNQHKKLLEDGKS